MKVHEKTTYASKVNFRTTAMIHPADSDSEKEEEDSDKAVAVKDDPQFTIAVTRGIVGFPVQNTRLMFITVLGLRL